VDSQLSFTAEANGTYEVTILAFVTVASATPNLKLMDKEAPNKIGRHDCCSTNPLQFPG
jgi:hypothetical protein